MVGHRSSLRSANDVLKYLLVAITLCIIGLVFVYAVYSNSLENRVVPRNLPPASTYYPYIEPVLPEYNITIQQLNTVSAMIITSLLILLFFVVDS
jgi:hypothetical protein